MRLCVKASVCKGVYKDVKNLRVKMSDVELFICLFFGLRPRSIFLDVLSFSSRKNFIHLFYVV